MENVFISKEARLEFEIELRKVIIREVLNYGELEHIDAADILSDILFALTDVFQKS